MLLLVAVNASSVQSMKFTRHLISNSSLGVTVVVLHMPSVEHYPHHHFLPSTSPFSTWNALALTRSPKGVAVHKLLLHFKCLGCGFGADILCMISVLRHSKGTPCVILLRHYLRRLTGEASAPHFHQLTTLRVVIPTKCLLVQRQSPVSHSYTVDNQSADTVQIWPHKTLQSYRKSYENAGFLTTAHAYT